MEQSALGPRTSLLRLLSLSIPPFLSLLLFSYPVLSIYVILSCLDLVTYMHLPLPTSSTAYPALYTDRLSRTYDSAYILACALPHGPTFVVRYLLIPRYHPLSQLTTSMRTRHR